MAALPWVGPNDGSWLPHGWAERRGQLALGLLLAVGIAVSFAGTVGNPSCQDMDFGAYYRAAHAVRRGTTLYVVDEYGPLGTYPYAPAFAYLLVPLGELDYLKACRCWLALNWLATAAGVLLALRLTLGPGRRPADAWIIVAAAVVPVGAYLWANLHVGQASMLMVLGCLAWADCRRRERSFRGGLFLAGAVSLKLAPAVLAPYLVVRRDWRGLAGLGAGLLGLFLLPAAWVGLEGTARLHRQWFRHTLLTQVPVQTYRPGNQSLLAQLARLAPVSNGHQCFSRDRLAALCRVYPLLLALVAGALYGWILWDRRRSAGCRADVARRRENVHLALLLVLMTLAHPRAWRCNFVGLVFPCILLVDRCRLRRPGWRLGLTALALVALACVWPTNGLGEQGWSLGAWLLQGKHFWGGLAVALALPQGRRVVQEVHPAEVWCDGVG
jgi:hypothetical protein